MEKVKKHSNNNLCSQKLITNTTTTTAKINQHSVMSSCANDFAKILEMYFWAYAPMSGQDYSTKCCENTLMCDMLYCANEPSTLHPSIQETMNAGGDGAGVDTINNSSHCSSILANRTVSINSRCGHCGSVNIYNEEPSGQHSVDITDSFMTSWRVEIADFPGKNNKEVYPVSAALTECKTHVLRPYRFILCLIGWKPWGQDTLYADSKIAKVLNVIYTIFVIVALLFFYWSTAHRCETMEFKHEQTLQPAVIVTPSPHNYTSTLAVTENNMTIIGTTVSPGGDVETKDFVQCRHFITSFIIPDVLHFIAYLMGLWFFRIKNNEHLYALIEKVYIEVTMFTCGDKSIKRLTNTLRLYLFLGVLWVVSQGVRHMLFIIIFSDDDVHRVKFEESYFEALNAIGLCYVSFIYMTVLLVYGAICTLLGSSFDRITVQLREKTQDLKEVMQDVLNLKGSVSNLNGFLAKMVSILLFVYCNMFIITLVVFYYNSKNTVIMWAYIILSVIQQMSFIAFPFIQAARLMGRSKKLKNMALEIRVFGYQNLSQIDRDSFLSFIMNAPIIPKIFHSSVHPSLFLAVITLLSLLIIFLIQTDIVFGGLTHL